MKIYQLHKYGGEYEDAYDYIVGSYMKEERAEEEKIKAEKEEKELQEQANKCNQCVFIKDGSTDFKYLLDIYSGCCDKVKLIPGYDMVADKEWIGCENRYFHCDKSWFYIEEVKVEE